MLWLAAISPLFPYTTLFRSIAMAAQHIIVDKAPIMVAGGVESISTVQANVNTKYIQEEWLAKNKPELYWTMLQTAENVAKRYNRSEEHTSELQSRENLVCRL